MKESSATADVKIHLRVVARDLELIDQAARLVGANRSQFMLASALKEAKNVLLDQTTLFVDARASQKIMDWMDAEATPSEAAGMRRILDAKAPWIQGQRPSATGPIAGDSKLLNVPFDPLIPMKQPLPP